MKYLLKSIKATLATAIPSMANRVFMSVVPSTIKLADGPYIRVVFVGQDDTQYAFSDQVGYDQTVLQFSVFAESLTGADTIVDSILVAFQGVALTLDVGVPARGLKNKRGIIVEPKSPNANQTFHSWVTINFFHEDKLS